MNSMNDTLSKGSWEGVYMLGALTQIFLLLTQLTAALHLTLSMSE